MILWLLIAGAWLLLAALACAFCRAGRTRDWFGDDRWGD